MRLSSIEVRSRQGDSSLAQGKKAIPMSILQDTPPQGRNKLPEGPSRVWLAILVIVNLFIFAVFARTIFHGLVT